MPRCLKPFAKEQRFEVNGIRVVLTHGHVSMWHYTLNYLRLLITGRKVNVRAFRERLAKLYPEADLINFRAHPLPAKTKSSTASTSSTPAQPTRIC